MGSPDVEGGGRRGNADALLPDSGATNDPGATDGQALQLSQRSQDSIVAETQGSQSSETEAEGGAQDTMEEQADSEREVGKDQAALPTEPEQTQTDTIVPAVGARAPEVEAQPQELFAAVVAAMQAAPEDPPHAAWTETIVLLYAKAHDSVTIAADLVPANKQRYPKLKADEQGLLSYLFKEACVISKTSYVQWVRLEEKLTHDLYNTRWSFKHIVQNLISREKWARIKPLNQWAEKAKGGQAAAGAGQSPGHDDGTGYLDYMFNPAVYSTEETAQLTAICRQHPSGGNRRGLREGTKAEWRIISGLAEGTIVSRKAPSFLRSVLDSRERLRLYKTIQAQVEGELVLKLRLGNGIRLTRQSTSAIKEDILLAAEESRVNQDELRTMLNAAKTISYNYVGRSIHFFYFDRATAKKHESTMVPFKRRIYRVVNAHNDDARPVWARQFDRNGVRTQNQQEYEIEVQNVTRFTDIGRLTAYFEHNIQAPIDFEDMDSCTPESRTSTVWKLTIKMPGCPEFLRGIVRILWFGQTLVLTHPGYGQRLQCIQCGNMGHPMARCRYTDELLRGQGSRVAAEADLADLEDLGRPFTSLKEVKETAEKRLQLQRQKEQQEQEAVQPLQSQRKSGQQETTTSGSGTQQTPQLSNAGSSTQQQIEPEPKQQWVTQTRPNGTKRHAHPDTLRRLETSPRFAVFEEDEETKAGETPGSAPSPRSPEVEEISSGSEPDDKQQMRITAEAKAKLFLVSDKPNKAIATPQLVALKQRERTALAEALELTDRASGAVMPLGPELKGQQRQFGDIQQELGIRPVATPSSGNCMAMAIAQALADQDLAGDDRVLEKVTANIKRGIRWSGHLNLTEQFNHFVRTTTLINVQRGWEGMDPKESLKQFKWYLDEYGMTSSERLANVPRHKWGCSEFLAQAANFLQRKIYVLAFDTDKKKQWYCSVYQPSTMTRGRKVIETGQQRSLQVDECVAAIRGDKAATGPSPLVLRYWGEHYSAFVHSSPEHRYAKGTDSEQGASQEPWNPADWNGDVTELRSRLNGLTIAHELQQEIRQILDKADPERYRELLTFMVHTESQLSQPQRTELLTLDLKDAKDPAVRKLLQRYQIPRGVLLQWQRMIRAEYEEDQNMEQDSAPGEEQDSDSSYNPSSALSSQSSLVGESHATKALTTTPTQKRNHSTTPVEGEEIRQIMKTQEEAKRRAASAVAMQDIDERSAQEATPATRDAWPELWLKLGKQWPASAQIPLPHVRSSMEEWTQAAQKEPSKLLYMVQRFPYPEELLTSLSEKVLEEWTAGWRRGCLYAKLGAYRARTTDPSVLRWLDEWRSKFPLRETRLPPLTDNRDDWIRMRACGYGNDEVLKLCDIGNKLRLAQPLLCAVIYEQEIRVILGLEDEEENSALARLKRHLDALRTHEGYKTAYATAKHSLDWFAVARFFSATIARGEGSHTLQY